MKKIHYFIAVSLIVIGILVLFVPNTPLVEYPLLIGLFTLLTAEETIKDERSTSIRYSSIFIALISGYAIKILINSLHQFQVIEVDLTSINYFLIIVLAIANVTRYVKTYSSI
jgi:uncharacterized membrane protein HdeD (DUF308 family)